MYKFISTESAEKCTEVAKVKVLIMQNGRFQCYIIYCLIILQFPVIPGIDSYLIYVIVCCVDDCVTNCHMF